MSSSSDQPRSRSSERGNSKKSKKEKKDKKDSRSSRSSNDNADLIAAINGHTSKEVSRVERKVDILAGKVETVENDVGELKDWKTEVDKKLENLGKGKAPDGGPLVEGNADFGNGGGGRVYPPPNLRKTVIFGMFDADTPREEIVDFMKEYVTCHATVKDWIVPAKYCDKGKVEFTTPKAMWAWIMSKVGQKFAAQGRNDIWFSVDKPFDERQLGKKIGTIMKAAKNYVKDKHKIEDPKVMKKWVDGDSNKGFVYLRNLETGRMVKAAKKIEDGVDLEIAEGGPIWPEFNLKEVIDRANDGLAE